jgi:preprotein translocase subunit SecG
MIFWQLPTRQPVFEDLMETIHKAVLIAHTLFAIGIIALVLLQRGKGADAGAAFGAGASGTVFGSRGSGSFFSRATAVLATAFFATSLTLAYLSAQGVTTDESLIDPSAAIEERAETAEKPAEDVVDDTVPALENATESNGEVPVLEEEMVDEDSAGNE